MSSCVARGGPLSAGLIPVDATVLPLPSAGLLPFDATLKVFPLPPPQAFFQFITQILGAKDKFDLPQSRFKSLWSSCDTNNNGSVLVLRCCLGKSLSSCDTNDGSVLVLRCLFLFCVFLARV